MSQSKKWYNGSWVLTILGGTLATVAGTLIYDAIKDQPILSTLFKWLVFVGKFIQRILTFEIKVWWLLIAIAIGVLVVIVLSIVQTDTKSPPPGFTSYKKDVFKTWTWRWEWEWGKNGWGIVNLNPYCPNCDTPLVYKNYTHTINCPRCNYQVLYSESPQDIRVLINDNITKRRSVSNQGE